MAILKNAVIFNVLFYFMSQITVGQPKAFPDDQGDATEEQMLASDMDVPQGDFCLVSTNQYVFIDTLKQSAPSAQFYEAVSLTVRIHTNWSL